MKNLSNLSNSTKILKGRNDEWYQCVKDNIGKSLNSQEMETVLYSLLDQFMLFQCCEDFCDYEELRCILCTSMENLFAEPCAEGIVQSLLEEEEVLTVDEYIQGNEEKTSLG